MTQFLPLTKTGSNIANKTHTKYPLLLYTTVHCLIITMAELLLAICSRFVHANIHVFQ